MEEALAKMLADMIAPKIMATIDQRVEEMAKPRPICYTIDETAELMKVCRQQVSAWIRSKKLPAFHPDSLTRKKYLIAADDIDILIERLKADSERATA